MYSNRWRRRFGLLFLLLMLAACGQSGGDQAGQATAPDATARTLVSRPTATLPGSGGSGASAGYSRPLAASAQGDDVSAVQARLIELGYADFSEPNGNYGPKTQAAVTAFQQANGLEADGVVGPKTWAALFDAAAVAKAGAPPAPAGEPPTPIGSPAPAAPTDVPAAPPPADEPPSAVGGRLLYLADDGQSIKSLALGSTGEESTLATLQLGTGEIVTFFTADPSGELVLYGVADANSPIPDASRMFSVRPDGTSTLIDIVVGEPSWSPDGSRYAVQLFDYAQNQPYYVVVRGLDGGFFSTELVGARPRWAADGQHLLWEAGGNLISYDLNNTGPTNPAALRTNFPEEFTEGSWFIQEAAGLADGTVAFYGGPSDSGGNGNNRGWYTLSGNDPVEWAPAEGATLRAAAFNPARDLLAYAVTVSAGPCRRNDYLYVRPANPGSDRLDNPNFDFDTSQAVQIEGLSWNPATSQQLAVAMQPYECGGDGEKKFGPAGIYVWDPNEGGSATPAQVASGFYPVWVK